MEIEENVRARELTGFLPGSAGCLIAIPLTGMFFLFNLPQQIGWLVFNEQYIGLFLGLALCATFILIPVKPGSGTKYRSLVRLARSVGRLSRGALYFHLLSGIVNSLGDIVD